MIELTCRCLGKDRDCECPEQATGEDGLCDNCRTPKTESGCCEGATWQELDRIAAEWDRKLLGQ